MEFLSALWDGSGKIPHGFILGAAPAGLWSIVVADAVIALTSLCIPIVVGRLLWRVPQTPMNRAAWPIGIFLVATGVTRVLDIWALWQPAQGLEAIATTITAIVALLAALAVWRLTAVPQTSRAAEEHRAAIRALEEESGQRRSAEAHLQALEQTLAATIDSMGGGFISTNRQGEITRMNATAERVTGWAVDEARGRSLWQVFQREGRPCLQELMNSVDAMLACGDAMGAVHHVTALSRGGRRSQLEVKSAVMRNVDGEPAGMVLVFRDLLELARMQSEATTLAAIVTSSTDAIIGKNLEGRITSWNQAAAAMFGYSAAEAIGQSISMLIPPDRQQEELNILADIGRGVPVMPFETVRRAKNGELLEVSVAVSPIRDSQGRVVGAAKSARDISRAHRAEAALRASGARLRFTLDAAQIGDWELDVDSGDIQRSLRHDRCFGYSDLQPEWNVAIFLDHVFPDDRPEVALRLQSALTARSDWRVECRVVWPDASVHWIEANGKMYHDDGAPRRMLGIVMDTTRHRIAEGFRLKALSLEAENHQIVESSRLKGQFLANMSHELRTPLTAIIGFADLIKSGAVAAGSEQHAVFVGHIASSGRHLLRLINDVLDLSKVESGKFEFFPVATDLRVAVLEVTDMLQTDMQRKHLRVELNLDDDLGPIRLDPGRLKQVLYNYVSNAIKFSPANGRIGIAARTEGAEHFRIEVEDAGVGIAESDLPRLFVEFEQLNAGSAKRHQGTGLGLALTRRLIEAQGGSVGVRSLHGQGSTFFFVLPRKEAGMAPEGLPASIDAGASERRLLVIEDNLMLRQQIVEGMRLAGFEVDCAATEEEAVQQASGKVYHALTLDLAVSERRGLGVLNKIREQAMSRMPPVIGLAMNTDFGNATVFAIADILTKPLQQDEILVAMSRLRRDGPRPPSVMVIDDDPLALDLMHACLAAIGINAISMLDAREALARIDEGQPDAIILDLTMPEFDGFAMLDALRGRHFDRDLPVFIWTNMVLTAEDYAVLNRSARAIASKGGGRVPALLGRVGARAAHPSEGWVPIGVAPEFRPPVRGAREGMRILLVDDDSNLLRSVQETLVLDRHRVHTATGGQSGIAMFEAAVAAGEPFDVVITDLGMPQVDGRAVAAAVKGRSPATPVILLTGWGERLEDVGDVPGSVDIVLSKPPRLRDLREGLARCRR